MIIKDINDIGQIIKQIRKSQGLTQSDLATSAGVGIRFIVDIENGKETAQIGKVIKLCNMLGIKIDIS